MKNTLIIPDETRRISLKASQKVRVETNGRSVRLQAGDNTVFIKAKASGDDSDAFPVHSGNCVEFCGAVTVFSEQDTEVFCLFYTTL